MLLKPDAKRRRGKKEMAKFREQEAKRQKGEDVYANQMAVMQKQI